MKPSPFEIARRHLTLATHRIHTLPIVILLPQSRCNCRCVMCDIWQAEPPEHELSREALVAHLEGFRRLHVQCVVLSGGEALLHSDLWGLCDLLRVVRVKSTLLTNGLLLARHATEVVRHCDSVIVSLDGGPAIHDAIRNVPGAYGRLAVGVRALKSLAPAFPVSARAVVQRRNYAHLPEIIESARALGLDSISFLAADVSSTAFNRLGGGSAARARDLALTAEEVKDLDRRMEDTLHTYASQIASGFIAESAEKLQSLVRYFAALNGAGDFPPVRCNAPWVSTVIEADGTVRPCFFHRPLGNIHEQPLAEILNSPQAIAFRRGLDVTQNPICRRCTCSLFFGRRAVC